MLLYIHVPFCRSKCTYCAFYSVPLDMELLERYTDSVVREARLWGKRLNRPKIQTVYLGGGTPSIVPPWAMERIIRGVGEHFQLDKATEFSMESNPDSVDSAALGQLREMGVNRLSMGVQSLDDSQLKMLGRPHTAAQAVMAFRAARNAGFRNINLDFIWGVPGMRLGSWRKQMLAVTKELKPEHLSCYNLTLEPNTPLERRVQSGKLEMPADNEQARIFVHGAHLLEDRGYLHYEISNFARMGFFCRHNLGYWDGQEYVGLGPSAVSTVQDVRYENPKDIDAWDTQIRRNETVQGEQLSKEVKTNEMVMLSLRTSRGLDLKRYKDLTGQSFTKQYGQILTALRQHDLIRITKAYVRLTKNGMLVSNAILERLLLD
ncbi:MAG: radical SAM family heme chaperone HemW [Desulfovibrio sp.]|uniref:radical SAM family heme chaperone HemW n=1 Tax=Desulfovibrio sp. 7SRBS1 TaxID=3378064 RepID=UPI003B41F03A